MESDMHYACSVARGFMMGRTILLFNTTNSSLFGAHFFFFLFLRKIIKVKHSSSTKRVLIFNQKKYIYVEFFSHVKAMKIR